MSKPPAHLNYLEQQIKSASPARLVLMLYERAIISLKDAIDAIEKGDIERRYNANKRATDIVTHMLITLDVEKGGEIAKNLDRLFSFILTLLPNVDFKNDPQPARDVIKLLEPLRDAWKQLVDQQAAAAAITTPNFAASTSAGEKPTAPLNFSVSA